MEVKPKDFICTHCKRDYYGDKQKCLQCGRENTIQPIQRDYYKCYLNGVFYGIGDLKYMQELFVDYVVTCKMYGREQCEFNIVKAQDKVNI